MVVEEVEVRQEEDEVHLEALVDFVEVAAHLVEDVVLLEVHLEVEVDLVVVVVVASVEALQVEAEEEADFNHIEQIVKNKKTNEFVHRNFGPLYPYRKDWTEMC